MTAEISGLKGSTTYSFRTYAKTSKGTFYGEEKQFTTVSPTEIYISDAGYATFYDSQYTYTLPESLSALVVTGVEDSRPTYITIADGKTSSSVIPKGVAVILKSDIKKTGTYELTRSGNAASYMGENLLHGSDNATTTTASDNNSLFYKLTYGPATSSQKDVFGWYWGETGGKAFSIEGHKAWLAVPKPQAARSFGLDDENTEAIADEKGKLRGGPCYDLQGRCVVKPVKKGIYIQNGKKFVIK